MHTNEACESRVRAGKTMLELKKKEANEPRRFCGWAWRRESVRPELIGCDKTEKKRKAVLEWMEKCAMQSRKVVAIHLEVF